MRRSSIETIERFVKDVHQSAADQARERRLSLTIMNCIWARNTETETIQPVEGKVTYGVIPTWLEGNLYKIGPGIIQVGDNCYNHPLDMLGVIHKFTLSTKGCTYQNKIVDSRTSTQVLSGTDQLVSSEAIKSSKKLSRFPSFFNRSGQMHGSNDIGCEIQDNCIDNIFFYGRPGATCEEGDREMYIVSEVPHLLRIDPVTLDTISRFDIEENTPVSMMASHPHVDDDGTVWNIGTSCRKSSGYCYSVLKFSPSAEARYRGSGLTETGTEIATIPARCKGHPSYIHSFGMSENFVVVPEQPLYLDDSVSSGCLPSSERFQKFRWKKGVPVRFYVVDKVSGKVLPQVYESSHPFFFFHVINTFEHDGGITIDMMVYKDSEILNELKFSRIERTDKVPSAQAVRIRLLFEEQRKVSTVKLYQLVPEPMEFPRLNYRAFNGRSYKYFYSLGNDYLHPNKIYKVDLETRDVMVWKDPGHFVSEPIFVPRKLAREDSSGCGNIGGVQPKGNDERDAAEEDDGVIILTLLNAACQRTVKVVVIDAETFAEVARVSFVADGPVSQALHGIFAPSDASELPRY